MRKIPLLMVLPPLLFLGLAVMFMWGMQRGDSRILPSALAGMQKPAIIEQTLADYPAVTDASFSNGVTLVNFWASWCPPCRAEHPRLLQMQADGLPIVGVNFKDQASQAAAYLLRDGNPFNSVAFDAKGRTAIDWGVTAPPETFIVSREGVILFRFQGPLVGTDYENRFLPALTKALANDS